jgi:SAM-dependent methyltransferase
VTKGWEDRAEAFIAWARTPGHDAYWRFRDSFFDLVVAYNTLMDVEDMPAAVGEAARVLESGGRFCVRVTHPFRDAGRFASREAGAPFVVSGSYFEEGSYEFAAERSGLSFTFASRNYPLRSYTGALGAAGLLVESIREPVGWDDRDSRMPQFLLWRSVKP